MNLTNFNSGAPNRRLMNSGQPNSQKPQMLGSFALGPMAPPPQRKNISVGKPPTGLTKNSQDFQRPNQ